MRRGITFEEAPIVAREEASAASWRQSRGPRVSPPPRRRLMIPLLVANSLALASLLIMMSSGLALIYGLRDVINFGHGALYMLGAYLGYSIAHVAGFWVALVVSPVLLALRRSRARISGAAPAAAAIAHRSGARHAGARHHPRAGADLCLRRRSAHRRRAALPGGLGHCLRPDLSASTASS